MRNILNELKKPKTNTCLAAASASNSATSFQSVTGSMSVVNNNLLFVDVHQSKSKSLKEK